MASQLNSGVAQQIARTLRCRGRAGHAVLGGQANALIPQAVEGTAYGGDGTLRIHATHIHVELLGEAARERVHLSICAVEALGIEGSQ